MRTSAAVLCLAAVAACSKTPRTGDPVVPPEKPIPGLQLVISSASIDLGHVVVSFAAIRDGKRLTGDDARKLDLAWTLAGLEKEPVTGLPAWRSFILTGAQTIPSLPVAGPGTPPEDVLAATRQPGAESSGTISDNGYGTLSYTFSTPLPAGFDLSETLRAGVFLRSGDEVSTHTTSTIDFRPDLGTPSKRELVLDANCGGCHGVLRHHAGTRTGTAICVTCHTFQHADPDTTDPAAAMSATSATNPNPLELGRLVHRIHRGKNLPTQYVATTWNATTGVNAVATVPSTTALPLPFAPGSRNTALLGRKFSVVGEQSAENVFAQVVNRTDNGQPAKLVAQGISFPRDYRDCAACHAGAAQASALTTEISRRTCQGCHPEVWFGTDAPDQVHFGHPGGAQADDSGCSGCHIAATAEHPKIYAPIADIHVALSKSSRTSLPSIRIVDVKNLRAGASPTITFDVSDRNGPIDRLGMAPTVLADAFGSPVPRQLTSVRVTIAGPSTPDYHLVLSSTATGVVTSSPISETVVGTTAPLGWLVPLENGRFSYTMATILPGGTTGTWAVDLEASRRFPSTSTAKPPFYDPATDTFAWPYTGEALTELADNDVTWIDARNGALGGGTPSPRRHVVDTALCNTCHLRRTMHGSRTTVAYCVQCHTPDRTDWGSRWRTSPPNLAATYDGIEERSLEFKVLVHRIHTGGRKGTAALDAIEPFVTGKSSFHDDGRYPGNLADCRACHLEGTWALETIPADASPTIANETATIRHVDNNAIHPATDPATPPMTSACLSCHDTGFGIFHAAQYTIAGKEQCLSCHGEKGAYGVSKTHGLAP